MKFENSNSTNISASSNTSNTNTSYTSTSKSNSFRRRFPPYPPFDSSTPPINNNNKNNNDNNDNTTGNNIKVSHDKLLIRNSTLAFIAQLKHEANFGSREIQRLVILLKYNKYN